MKDKCKAMQNHEFQTDKHNADLIRDKAAARDSQSVTRVMISPPAKPWRIKNRQRHSHFCCVLASTEQKNMPANAISVRSGSSVMLA